MADVKVAEPVAPAAGTGTFSFKSLTISRADKSPLAVEAETPVATTEAAAADAPAPAAAPVEATTEGRI